MLDELAGLVTLKLTVVVVEVAALAVLAVLVVLDVLVEMGVMVEKVDEVIEVLVVPTTDPKNSSTLSLVASAAQRFPEESKAIPSGFVRPFWVIAGMPVV